MNESRSPALKNHKKDSDNESIDAQPVDLACLVYSVCLVCLVCLVQPANKINQIDRIDQIDETDQMNKPRWQTFSATC
jgi:hypothetical protein